MLAGLAGRELPPTTPPKTCDPSTDNDDKKMAEPHICKCKCDSTMGTGELCNTTVPPNRYHLSRCKKPLRLDWARQNSLKHTFKHNCHEISCELAHHFERHHMPNKRFPSTISAWETFDKHIWNILVITLPTDGLAVLGYLQMQLWPNLCPIYIWDQHLRGLLYFTWIHIWGDCSIPQQHGITFHNIDQLESQYTSGVLYLQREWLGLDFETVWITIICGSSPMGLEQQMIFTRLILGLHPANERRRYKVTPSLIGRVPT